MGLLLSNLPRTGRRPAPSRRPHRCRSKPSASTRARSDRARSRPRTPRTASIPGSEPTASSASVTATCSNGDSCRAERDGETVDDVGPIEVGAQRVDGRKPHAQVRVVLNALQQRGDDLRRLRRAPRPFDAEQALGRGLMIEKREADRAHLVAQRRDLGVDGRRQLLADQHADQRERRREPHLQRRLLRPPAAEQALGPVVRVARFIRGQPCVEPRAHPLVRHLLVVETRPGCSRSRSLLQPRRGMPRRSQGARRAALRRRVRECPCNRSINSGVVSSHVMPIPLPPYRDRFRVTASSRDARAP